MSTAHHDHPPGNGGVRPEDLDLYALHALPADETEDVEQALVNAPAGDRASMLAHIASTREVAADMVAGAHLDTAPPPALRARILEAAAAARPAGSATARPDRAEGGDSGDTTDEGRAQSGREDQRGAEVADLGQARERRRPRMWTAIGAAAAAIVLLVAGVVIGRLTDGASTQEDLPTAAPPAATMPDEVRSMLTADDLEIIRGQIDGAGVATVLASRSADMAVISMDGLPELAEGRAYQLWLMSDDHDPIPAGTMEAGQVGATPAAQIAGIGDSAQVGLTEEPAGGSPAPTGDVLLALDLA